MGTNYNVLLRAKKLWTILAVMLISLPSFYAVAQSNCPPVTNITVTNLQPTSAKLEWAPSVTGNSWYDLRVSTVEITSGDRASATANTPGVVVFENQYATSQSSYLLTGLTGGTHYYVYLRHNRQKDDEGVYDGTAAWQTIEFYTPCEETTTLPQTANFDDVTMLPTCWYSEGSNPVVVSTTHYGESGNSLKIVSDEGTSTKVYSPVFAPSAQAYYLSLKVYSVTESLIRVGMASADDLEAVLEVVEGGQTVPAGVWTAMDFATPADMQALCASGNYVWVIYTLAGDDATLYVDDIVIEQIPTCIAPNNLHVEAVEANAVTLAWNERGTANAWTIEYRVAGTEESTTVAANTNPFVVNGLEATTNYEFRVKAVCSASDESNWTDWTSVTTPCEAFPIPFVEDFTGLSAGVPECWDNSVYTCTPNCTWNYYSDGGNPVLRFNAFNAYSGTTGTLLTPPIANGETTNLMLTFDMKNGGNATLDIAVSTDGGMTFPIVLATAEKGLGSWKTFEYPFTAPANSLIVVSFFATSDYGSYRMDIDNIDIAAAPTCAKPSALHLAGFDGESATLAWTAGENNETNWILTYALNGGDVQTVEVSGTPAYEITGLEPQTTYTLTNLSVQAVCGADDSSRVVTAANITFKTACSAQPLPFTEGFEGTTFVPDCWYTGRLAGTAGGWSRTTSSGDYHSGSAAAKLADAQVGNRNILTTPMFHADEPNTVRFTFWMKRVSSSKPEEGVRVWVNTTPADTLGGTALLHVTRAYEMGGDGIKVPAEAAAGWYKYGAEIPVAGDFYLIFEGISEYGNYSVIDDIVVEDVPTCDNQIYNLKVAKLATEATLYWPNPKHNNQWELTYKVGNNDIETVIVNDTAYTIEGLNANTQYTLSNLAIRVICAEGDTSVWNTFDNITFRTACAAVSLPFAEDFNDLLEGIPSCWDNSETTLPNAEHNWGLYPDASISRSNSTSALDGNCLIFNSYMGSKNCYGALKTPIFTVPTARQVEVSFAYKNPKGGDFSVYVSRDGGNTYENEVLATELTNQAEWTTVTYFFHAVPEDNLCIVFKATSNFGNDDAYVYLDNVEIKAPLCARPTGLNISANAAHTTTIQWANSAANSYQVLLFATNKQPSAAAEALVNEEVTINSITFNNLGANHLYYMYVKGACEEEDSEWSKVFTFRTECEAVIPPYNEGFEEAGSYLCWQVIGAVEDTEIRETSARAFEGTKSIYVSAGSNNVTLVSPRMDVENLDEYKLWLAAYSAVKDTITVYITDDPTDPATFGQVGEIQLSAGVWNEYQSVLTVEDFEDAAHYIVLIINEGSEVYFDAVSVAVPDACPKPTSLSVVPNGENVLVDWASEAEAHYAEIVTENNEAVFAGNVEKPFTPAGLAANATYKVRVRAICGDDQSDWSIWYTFKTPCQYEPIPYAEGFENIIEIPECWYQKQTVVGSSTSGSYAHGDPAWVVYAGTSASYIHNGDHSLQLQVSYNGTRTILATPMFHSDHANALTLSFWMYRVTGSSKQDEGVKVWVNTAPSLEGATPLLHVTRCGGVAADSLKVEPITAAGWYQYETTLPMEGGIYVIFEGISEYGSSSYLDDIQITETPACPKPSGLTLGIVTGTTAQLTWTAGLDETEWELRYNGQVIKVENMPAYLITDLTPATDYTLRDITLQSVCSATDSSEVVAFANISFTTACETLPLPYEHNFNNLSSGIPACWDNSEGTTTTDSYKWNAYPTESCLRFNSYTNSSNLTNTLKTPLMNVGNVTQVIVSFSYKNPTGGDYEVSLFLNGVEQVLASDLIGITDWTTFRDTITVSPNDILQLAFKGTSNWGYGDAYLYLDDVMVDIISDCNRPAALTVNDILTNSATVSFVDEEGSAWEYVLNSVENEPIALTATEFVLESLTPNTDYTVYVRRVCGAGSVSPWTSVTFSTLCMTTGLTEDFEAYTTNDRLPNCWSLVFTESSTYPKVYSGASYATSGTKSLVMYGDTNYDTPWAALIALPELDGNLTDYRVRFNAKCVTDNYGAIGVFALNAPTDAAIDAYEYAQIGFAVLTSDFAEYTISLASDTTNYKYVGFYFQAYANIYMDDVVLELIPDCDKPAQVTLAAVGSDNATIEITDAEGTAWDYVVNDVDTEATTVTANTFTINGLEPSTTYTVYVRRNCGEAGVSEWRSVSFKTTCVAATLPFAEDFNTYTGVATSTSVSGTPALPDCWEFVNNNVLDGAYPQAFITSYSGYNVSGNALFMKSATGESMYALLPALDTENDVKVSFYYRNESTSESDGTLSFGYYMPNGTFEAIGTYERITSMTAVRVIAPYREGARLAFCYMGGTSSNYYCSIDNIVVNELADCEAPDAVSVSNITDESIDITITDAIAAHTAWEAVIVAHNADVTTGTPVAVAAKVATLTGEFEDQVEYDLYVRAICSETETSAWVGPITFKYVDLTAIIPFPVQETGNYPWTLDATGTRMESTCQGVANGISDMIATITVPEGKKANITFNYWVESEGTSTIWDYLCMYIDQANPSTSNYETSFDKKGGATIATGTHTFSLTEGTHEVRWRYCKDGSGNTGADKAQVWGFTIEYEDYFAAPVVTGITNLTAESATINWSAAAAATGHEVRLRTVSAGLDTIFINVVGNSLDVEDLEPNTAYAVYVRSANANNDTTAWSTAYRFTTPCVAIELPFAEDFDATSVIPDCWTNAHVAGSNTTVWSVSNNAAYINYQASGNEALLATPQFTMHTGVAYRIKFKTNHTLSSTNDDETHIYLANDAYGDSLVVFCNIKYGEFPTGTNEHYYIYTPEADMNACLVVKRIFDNDYGFYLDDVVIEEVPACDVPQSLAVVSAEATNMVVSISDRDANHNAWQVAVVAQNAAIDEDAAILVESSMASIALATPLVSGNTYDLYVRTACGEDETSVWFGPFAFKYVDYTGIADGMTISGDGAYPWEIIDDNGVQKLQSTNQGQANTTSDMLSTVVVPEGKIGILSFDYYVESEASYDYLCLYINESAPSTDNILANFGKKGSAAGVSGSYELIFTEAGTYTIRWRYCKDVSTDTGADAAQVWNLSFSLGAALPPTGLELDAATANEATISWNAVENADNYEVLFENETIATAGDTTITLTNLAANTTYSVAVRAILGNDTTAWSAAFTFRTDCEATMAIPFATGFEEMDGGLACWTIHQIATGTGTGSDYGDEGWQLTTRSTDNGESTSSIHSGLAAAQLRDQREGNRVLLASPEFNAVEGAVQISFWVYRSNSTYGGSPKQEEGIRVWVNNTNTTTDGGTALVHVPRQYSVGGTGIKVAPVAETGWYQYTAIASVNGNFYVLFEGINEYATSTYMDDIRIAEIVAAAPFEETICKSNNNEEGYEGHGFSISASQLHEGLNTFTRVHYAESDLESDVAYTLHLYVNMPSQSTVNDTICAGNAYSGYGFNISSPETRTYERHMDNVGGCDSTIYLNLYVRPTQFTATATICEGETYEFGGETLTIAGTYTHTFQGAHCDSIVALTLNVIAHEYDTITATITAGETYTENGFNVSEAGTYTRTEIAESGCEKTITLILTVEEETGLNTDLLNTLEIVPTLLEKGGYAEIQHAFTATDMAGMTIRVYDVLGQLVQEVNPANEKLQVGGFAVSGMYIVKIQTANNKQWLGQIVVK